MYMHSRWKGESTVVVKKTRSPGGAKRWERGEECRLYQMRQQTRVRKEMKNNIKYLALNIKSKIKNPKYKI